MAYWGTVTWGNKYFNLLINNSAAKNRFTEPLQPAETHYVHTTNFKHIYADFGLKLEYVH